MNRCSPDPTNARGLIVFAGHKLWSVVDALARWGDALDHVVVVKVETFSNDSSAVDRVIEFGKENFESSGTQFQKHSLEGVGPDGLFDQFNSLLDTVAPPTGEWLIDCTGLPDLMFAASLASVRVHENVIPIYRNHDGEWFAFEVAGQIRSIANQDLRVTDRFTASELVKLTWSSNVAAGVSKIPTDVEQEIVGAATLTLRGTGGWRQNFDAATKRLRGKGDKEVKVPILVTTRVIPRIIGSYGVVVPPACHCEMGFVSTSQLRSLAHFQG